MLPERVGMTSSNQTEVGLVNVEYESCIIVTPLGDVTLLVGDDISPERVLEAKVVVDKIKHALWSS